MTKPFAIPKALVWEAFQRVKANGGSAEEGWRGAFRTLFIGLPFPGRRAGFTDHLFGGDGDSLFASWAVGRASGSR